jgi:hypothetical protein
MAGLGKAGGMVSLTTLENATEAVEQNREMLITLGKALAPKAMGGGPAWNLRGTQIAGAAAQLTDEDYIRMAQRALGQYEWSELGRLTQRVPYPPPVQYGAFDIEGLQAFGRPPRFGPPGEIQGSGVVINCPITIWEANDREAVKAIVDAEIHTAIDKAWDEQVGLEAQVAGWPS